MSLTLEISDEVSSALRLPPSEAEARLRLELAISLYAQQILSLGKAAELAFTGDRIGAEECLRLGLVNQVVPADAFVEATRALAVRLAALPTRARLRRSSTRLAILWLLPMMRCK